MCRIFLFFGVGLEAAFHVKYIPSHSVNASVISTL